MAEDLRQGASEAARDKGHLLGGWQAHPLGWGGRCLFCGSFSWLPTVSTAWRGQKLLELIAIAPFSSVTFLQKLMKMT